MITTQDDLTATSLCHWKTGRRIPEAFRTRIFFESSGDHQPTYINMYQSGPEATHQRREGGKMWEDVGRCGKHRGEIQTGKG